MRIPLGRSGKFAIIDAEDWVIIKDYNWFLNSNGYAQGNLKLGVFGKKKNGIMHRLIMNAKEREIVDHIFGDKLDNRKQALRLANHSENMQNTRPRVRIGFKGVDIDRTNKTNPFRARTHFDRKEKHLGSFPTAEDAAMAYDDAVIKKYCERAIHQFLNFPERALGKINKNIISAQGLHEPPGSQMEFF